MKGIVFEIVFWCNGSVGYSLEGIKMYGLEEWTGTRLNGKLSYPITDVDGKILKRFPKMEARLNDEILWINGGVEHLITVGEKRH